MVPGLGSSWRLTSNYVRNGRVGSGSGRAWRPTRRDLMDRSDLSKAWKSRDIKFDKLYAGQGGGRYWLNRAESS